MRVPVSTPGGISTSSVCGKSTRPSPPQLRHGSVMTSPRPWQLGQGRSTTKTPCFARTLPMPEHRLQARAGAVAIVARLRDFDLDLRVLAVEGFFQADLHIVAKIGASARLRASAATEGLAEDRLEDIADIPEIAARMTAAALLERGVAIAIVGRAFLRVLEAIVGDADRLEFRLALAASRIAVRVVLHRELAIGGFDRPPVRIARDAEDFVKVDFGG